MPRPPRPAHPSASFSAFYDSTSPAAYSLAVRIARDPAGARAVCEEAYLRAWQTPGGATRECLLAFVQESARAAGQLSASLGQLPDADREVVELAAFGSLTAVEVASVLGVLPEDIRGALARGLRSLGERESHARRSATRA